MVVFTLFFILVFCDFTTAGLGHGHGAGMNRTLGQQAAASFFQPQASASHGWGWTSGGHGGGSGFNSFFDVALTGLAFLSFGTFLLNLLLNALLGYGYVTGTVYPTYNTNTGTGTGGIITQTQTVTYTTTGTQTQTGGRRKRSTPATFELDRVSSAEVMATVILNSIDAMVNEHECVKKVFCDGNKDAKSIGRGFQYLFPAYSLGASFIAQKYGLHNNISDHVDAVFHGMENSNCGDHFPQC